MKLTDTEKENLLRTFYRDKLLPVAAAAKRERVEIFPLGPDNSKSSYYCERDDSGRYVHEIDPDDLAGQLREIWSGGDLPLLAKIADALVELAESVRDDEPPSDDVSPFIYAMF